ncbi:RNA-directed DNA polymerase from mobile element jockey, partial [Operophtera brumata]
QCVCNTENDSRSVCETALAIHNYGYLKCNKTIPAEDKRRLGDCLDRRAWNWLSSGSINPRKIWQARPLSKFCTNELELSKNARELNAPLQSMMLAPTDPFEVIKIISKLKNSNSVGSDTIPTNLIKMFKKDLALPISYLCNLSLSRGIFPNAFKQAT